MRIFRNLQMRGPVDKLREMCDLIERALAKGWHRDKTAEGRMRATTVSQRELLYCFSCPKTGRYPAAVLFLMNRGDNGELFIPNIIPLEADRLTHDEYNQILVDFCETFVGPAALKTGVSVKLSEDQADLEKWMSREAAELLRNFSASANKSTGSSHPSDQERWMLFLVKAHRDNSPFDVSYLLRWLTENEGWSVDIAHQLAGEYEFGRALLAVSDKVRGS